MYDSSRVTSYFKYDQGDYLLDRFSLGTQYLGQGRNVHFHAFKRSYAGTYGQYGKDLVDLINGKLDATDVITGQYVRDYVQAKGDPLPMDNSGGWAYGSFWAIDESDGLLHFDSESGDAGPEFRQVTLSATFAEGVGLSGRAWQSRDLFFTPDLGQMTDCVRAPVAQRVGVQSGLCFPVIVDGRVVGTMDFFMLEKVQPSPQRLDTLRNVGRLVSQAFSRITKETSDREQAAELAAKVDVVLDVVQAAVDGDFTRELTITGDDAVGQLAGGLSSLLGTLRESMASIGQTADALGVAAEQLTILSQGMGDGASVTSDKAASASSS